MNILQNSLYEFYENNYNLTKLLEYTIGEKKISLRIIDWFVTNYSKKNNIYYEVYKDDNNNPSFNSENNNLDSQFNVYYSYKSQLKSYSKKRFDPFCRRDRIIFKYNDGEELETTIGQLNFFRWAIHNLVIEYIKDDYEKIEHDMNISYNVIKKKKSFSNERKKRQELSKSASRGLNSKQIKVVLDFN
tara:strand:- start:174 stop:737 length:564 start_codon:yes stop_codon:yes gene_type:complete